MSHISMAGPTGKVQWSRQNMTYGTVGTGGHYEKLRRLVTSRFQQSESYCRSAFERFSRYDRLINMITKKKMYDWKANVALPYALSLSEQSAAIKWLALFMTRPFVTVQARKGGLDEVATRRQALLDYHLTGDVDAATLGAAMLRKAERYGSAVAMVAPRWDTKVLKYRERHELPTATGTIARTAWKMRDAREYRIEAVDLPWWSFFPEPGKRNINGTHKAMKWCIRQSALTKDELLALEEGQVVGPAVGGEPVANLRDSQEQELNEFYLRRLLTGHTDDTHSYRDEFDQPVELLEYHGAVPREMLDEATAQREANMGLDPFNRIVILGNRHVVLQDIALPWDHGMKGFIKMDSIPDPDDFHGKGKVEPAEHLTYAAQEITNSRLDNVKMAINAMVGINNQKMPDGWKRRLMMQPFGIIETIGDPNQAIARLQIGDVTASSYTEQQQLWTLAQEATAVNETMLGAPGPERTLGEHQLKAESASKRLQFELAIAANQLLGFPYGLSGFILGLDKQYLPLPTYMRMVEPDTPDDFLEIALQAEDLAAEDEKFLYLATGATEGMNIQAKRADLAAMLQALQPFGPVLMTMNFNFPELVKTILKIFGHDPQKYFPKLGMGVQGPGTAPGTPGFGGMALPGQMPMPGGGGGMQMPGMPPGMGPGAMGQRMPTSPGGDVQAAIMQMLGAQRAA